MSSNSQSTTSYSSVSFSSTSQSSSSNGNVVSGTAHSTSSFSDPSGSHVVTQNQNLGEPVVREERHYDASGRETIAGGGSAGRIEGGGPRVEDVTDEEQTKRDREYEERIEEEYAKREGGA